MTAPEAPPGLGPRAPSTMDRDVTTRSTPYSFQEIVEEERKLLRELRQGGPPHAGQDGSSHDQDEFLGLSFSGGGIRSATFNLGVLQALSELRLLKEFDYLSTVSGGGYIGSWLSAWIHRAGIDTVEQQLSMKDHPHEEPREITFLRSYSNYLTPRTGIFSTDTLAAVATYLRNLILNLSIVLLCLTVVLLLPRLFAWAGKHLHDWPNALLACGALGLAVAVFFINLNLASQLPYSQSNRDKRSLGAKWKAPWYVRRTAVVVWIVLPLTLGAMALSFWLAGPAPSLSQALLTPDWPTLRRDAVDRRRHDRRDRLHLVLRPEDRGRLARAWRPSDVEMAAGRARDRRADGSGRAGGVPADHARAHRAGPSLPGSSPSACGGRPCAASPDCSACSAWPSCS